MDIEKWLLANYSLEEVDEIEDIYYITFWLKEDLKKFLDTCFKNDIMNTFAPPYSVACHKNNIKLLIKKIKYDEKSVIYPKIHLPPQIKLL